MNPPNQQQQQTANANLQKLYLYGRIGIAAAFLGCIADILLLYAPQGGYENMDYLFFHDISPTRLMLGHFLGILFIPFELIGFLQVFQMIKKAGNKWLVPLVIATIYVMVVGVTYHGMMGQMGSFLHFGAKTGISSNPLFVDTVTTMKAYFEPLGFVLFLVFLFISLSLSYLIFTNKTYYPKWMAFAAPLFSYIVFFLLYTIVPSIGGLFIVAGFNLSILILLAASTYALREMARD